MMWGTGSWNRVARLVPTRTGKQCRERWIGQLAPTVTKDEWLPEEEEVLLRAHAIHGNRWSAIATQLPWRTALSIKNHWNWLLRRNFSKPSRAASGDMQPHTGGVIKKKKVCQAVFDLLTVDNGLFGTGFQEFQIKMMGRELTP
jgi:myb proto-oncogene protein